MIPLRLLAVSELSTLPVSLERWLADLVAVGVDDLWLRERTLCDRDLLALVLRCRRALPGTVRVLVSARLDVAVLAGADGVQLPAAGLPAAPLRSLAQRLERPISLGRSTHTLAEVAAARAEGVDYVTFGPVLPTPSKAEFGRHRGLDELRRAVALGVPVIALGGVEAASVPALRATGVAGLAALRAFQTPERAQALAAACRTRARAGRVVQ